MSEPKATECKLVTFVPNDALEKVSDAIFAAGAGRIGQYKACSFRTKGVGTFFGEEGTSPTVGQAGRMETAEETKIETVVPLACVTDVVAALKQSHPYETPAFDLVELAAPPTGIGIGRVGGWDTPVSREAVFERIKVGLGIDRLLIAGPTNGDVSSAAVCAGAGGDFLGDALAAKADLYLTGELRHHDALRAAAAGMTVVCTLHSNSERVTLGHLRDKLKDAFSEVDWQCARHDADPFTIL